MVVLYLLTAALCITATISDLLYMKVFNKHLLYFLFFGILANLFVYATGSREFIIQDIINLFITIIVSFIMYQLQIWAAGDAKLFSILVFLLPYQIYNAAKYTLFPAFEIIMYAFSSAFIFIVAETMVLAIKNKDNEKREKISINKSSAVNFIITYSTTLSTISLADNIVFLLLNYAYYDNQMLIIMINILIIVCLLKYVNTKPKRIKLLIVTMLLNILYTLGNKQFIGFDIGIANVVIIAVVIWIRSKASNYNYEVIETDKVRAGMIMAFQTIMLFSKSRVKGLPLQTDETPDYRITKDEEAAIKRWKNSKYGQERITIVKHIPFAPCISVGLFIFVCIKLLLK